jgi:deoxyribonuclease-4
MMKLGAHMSIAGGVHRAIERGASIGCEAVQIFLKSCMQWKAKPLGDAEAALFRGLRRTTGTRAVFAHSCYLINMAAGNGVLRNKSIEALIDEVRRATALGIPFIVMHPGAHMGAGERTGLKRIARNLDKVFRATSGCAVRIALETTAGQGTNLGYRFEHLAEILQLSDNPRRLAACVDTCHLFTAGYDIRTPRMYEVTMRKLEAVIGRKQIVAFHLNDSLRPLGSRVDRHAHIGKGLLGLRPFRNVLRDPRWKNLPMVIETPKGDDLREDVSNLHVLRSLV